ncbi:MAG: fatty acid desaturase [Pseudomonadota bacterium]
MLSHGLLNASWWQIVLYTLVATHITIVTVTVYLHRCAAHRALDVHPALAHAFRFWNWLTTGMVTREWVAIHRKHHAFCETEDDPHSPVVQGIGKIFWEGAEAYRDGISEETVKRFGAGTPNDWVERNLYSPWKWYGIALMAVIDILLFGAIGLTVWAVQMLWIPVLAAGVINGVGHYWGYRNFECGDAARNISPWGILIGGEELHNNHHTYPNSAKLSQKPWEFDIGWFWIRLFETLGLVTVRSTGPISAREPEKAMLDVDAVAALVNDRFRVMARYAERVVRPAVDEAQAVAGGSDRALLRRAKKLLVREDSLVDGDGRQRLAQIFDRAPDLKLIYEYRMRLQSLWSQRARGAEQLLTDFKRWCADAEATGNQALAEFVAELKTYAMPKTAA